MNCFYFRSDQPHHLATVSKGLASPNIWDRLPYLNALHLVMIKWVGYIGAPDCASRLNPPTTEDQEDDMLQYEYGLARFYTQTYF